MMRAVAGMARGLLIVSLTMFLSVRVLCQRQFDVYEFKVSLVYKVDSRPAKATYLKPNKQNREAGKMDQW